MTAPVLARDADVWRGLGGRERLAAAIAVAGGTSLLLARPWLLPAGTGVAARISLFVAVGVVGVAWPLRRREWRRPATTSVAPAVLLGVVAFGLGWALGGWRAPVSGFGLAVALNALAAVAEEAFFRRLAYGWLERWGTAVATVASAALFAVAHVTVWGWGVLPLDLAAGLLLSWQRAATGRWSVPAATHVVANTLALL